MKSVEDLAREIHNECFIDVSQSERPKLQWDIDLASALIRADREAVIDACKACREGRRGGMIIHNLRNSPLTRWIWKYYQHEETGEIIMLPFWKHPGSRYSRINLKE